MAMQYTIRGTMLSVFEAGSPTTNFGIVDEIPFGYRVWHYGKCPPNYLPLCRLRSEKSDTDGTEVETESLKALPLDFADRFERISQRAGGTVPAIIAYKNANRNSRDESTKEIVQEITDLLPAIVNIPGVGNLFG